VAGTIGYIDPIITLLIQINITAPYGKLSILKFSYQGAFLLSEMGTISDFGEEYYSGVIVKYYKVVRIHIQLTKSEMTENGGFMKTTTNSRTLRMVQLALFSAIIIVMAFSPIGYIKTLGLSITLLVVPVSVGAIVLGPLAGAILGGIFGITSFLQCFGFEPFGTMLFSINPFATLILCLVPRILMGWLTGLSFAAIKKTNKLKNTSYAIASLIGPLLNTVLFMTVFILFFYHTDYVQDYAQSKNTTNVIAFVIMFVGLNGIIEAGINFVLGTAISKTLDVVIERTRIK